MMHNNTISEIAKQISRASDIALYAHTNPDGDALGSMLALYVLLKNKGKNVVCYCDTPVPDKYKCMYMSDCITFPEKRVHELAVSVDSGDLDRLGQCMKSFLAAKSTIAIDHHASFRRFAGLCYVDSSASACAEIVFDLAKELKGIDDHVAELLFSGIVTDSCCFTLPNTTKRTHEIACELMSYNFDAQKTICDVFRSSTLPHFKLKAIAMSKAQFFNDNRIGVIAITLQDFEKASASQLDSEGIVNELLDVNSVQVAFCLSQVAKHNFKMSIRTKGDANAIEIANEFGGGGHKNAAGCRANGYMEDVIEKLVRLASNQLY